MWAGDGADILARERFCFLLKLRRVHSSINIIDRWKAGRNGYEYITWVPIVRVVSVSQFHASNKSASNVWNLLNPNCQLQLVVRQRNLLNPNRLETVRQRELRHGSGNKTSPTHSWESLGRGKEELNQKGRGNKNEERGWGSCSERRRGVLVLGC